MCEIAGDCSTVLITGGSRGIGFALAQEFARNGHDLALAGRDEAALERAASEIAGKYSVSVSAFVRDLSEMGAAEALYEQIQREVPKSTFLSTTLEQAITVLLLSLI